MFRKRRNNINFGKSRRNRGYISQTLGENESGVLAVGAHGKKVMNIQNMLAKITENHRSIPAILVDGKYGENTKIAIEKFQEMMGISVTGNVDRLTLEELEKEYSICNSKYDSTRYNMNNKDGFKNTKYDSKIIGIGSSGKNVVELQNYINELSDKYKEIPKLEVDGKFGKKTEEAVRIFQGLFNIPTDGIVGRYTWTAIFDAINGKIEKKSGDYSVS